MTELLQHNWMSEDFVPLFKNVARGRHLDVGSGIRPFSFWGKPICLEPSRVYRDILLGADHHVIAGRAPAALRDMGDLQWDIVTMMDCIEHMEKEAGQESVEQIKRIARTGMIFTPEGFMAQDKDDWGLGEDDLQTHRSGWSEKDFPGWEIYKSKVWGSKENLGMLAIWRNKSQ